MCSPGCFIYPLPCLIKGPGVLASRTCMDKVMTSQALSHVRLHVNISLQENILKYASSIQFSKTNYISFGFLSFQRLEFIP